MHVLALVLTLLVQPVDQIEFRTHQPAGVRFGGFDGLDDELGGADVIGLLADLEAGLGVRDHFGFGIARFESIDLFGLEHLVHRAEAFPQNNFGALDLLARQAAVGLIEIPHHHCIERDAHAITGVAAQVLIGKEQYLLALLERPLQYMPRIGRGADNTAMLATEGLQISRGIDVGDRRDHRIGIKQRGQFAPGALDLGEIGHVGHGTAGGKIWQDGDLFRPRQDVRHLGHEMHAAEDDVIGLRLGRLARQLERVAGEIGVSIDFITLIVMTENHQTFTERGLGGTDAILAGRVVEGGELLYG